jgi:hypothetical protein
MAAKKHATETAKKLKIGAASTDVKAAEKKIAYVARLAQ